LEVESCFSCCPFCSLAWYLALRKSDPPGGLRVTPADAVSGPVVFLLLGWFALMIGCLRAWELLELGQAAGNLLIITCAVASVVPFVALFRDLSAMQKWKNQVDAFAAPSAVEQWERGESNIA
jgi:hypothetical protein